MSYVPHTEAEQKEMLSEIGAKSLDDLFAGTAFFSAFYNAISNLQNSFFTIAKKNRIKKVSYRLRVIGTGPAANNQRN